MGKIKKVLKTMGVIIGIATYGLTIAYGTIRIGFDLRNNEHFNSSYCSKSDIVGFLDNVFIRYGKDAEYTKKPFRMNLYRPFKEDINMKAMAKKNPDGGLEFTVTNVSVGDESYRCIHDTEVAEKAKETWQEYWDAIEGDEFIEKCENWQPSSKKKILENL